MAVIAPATVPVPAPSSVLLAFVPAGEAELASVRGLSVGIMSATQGQYTRTQLLLDITQGARVASSAYATMRPPALSVKVTGTAAAVEGWPAARTRAENAPQLLAPGLLATQIPGGGAYAGIAGENDIDAIAAADRNGRVALVSLGTAPTLPARIERLRRETRFVVSDLPDGAEGYADLRTLAQGRAAGELLLVVERALGGSGHELLWVAAAGLPGDAGPGATRSQGPGGPASTLSSQTTNERGLIAAVDLAPTILEHLRLTPIPADMRGDPIRTDGPLHSASLRALMARLHVISGRRLKALGFLLSAWALLLLVSILLPARKPDSGRSRRVGLAHGGKRVGARAANPGSRQAPAWAMRAGALGVLWAPVAVLIPAALEPSAPAEYATIALACLALGALSDRLLPWPRALLAPAIVMLVAFVADALAGTQLLMRSLLGPDPILGARFYGIGNELKSGLAVLVLAAVAAALYPALSDGHAAQRGPAARAAGERGSSPVADAWPDWRRRALLSMVCAGVLLAAIEGSAKIGAGVGGVILVSAAFALATAMLLPGALSRRRALIVLV